MNRKRRREMAEGVGTSVIVNNGDLGTALRVFKQEVKNSGKLWEYYNRREYIKPSERRRKEIDRAIYRNKKGLES